MVADFVPHCKCIKYNNWSNNVQYAFNIYGERLDCVGLGYQKWLIECSYAISFLCSNTLYWLSNTTEEREIKIIF